MWIAISARGLFQAYIVETKDFAINSNTYVNECIIKKKLVPFIKKCHSENNYICHYVKDTIAAFDEWKMKYAAK